MNIQYNTDFEITLKVELDDSLLGHGKCLCLK